MPTGLVALLFVAYGLASRVEFEIGTGSAIPAQLVFVPMLFALPPGVVPLCVAGGLLLGASPEILGRRMLSRWPVLLALLGARFAADFASTAFRSKLASGVTLRELGAVMGTVYAVDLALAPVGSRCRSSACSRSSPGERQRQIGQALELSQAYRGTAFLLGDVVEADDAYTGSHSRDVVELSLPVADELGLPPAERRHADLATLPHDVGKIRNPERSSTSQAS